MFQVQRKAQPLPFGPPVSSEILGSAEKGWASFPERPAGGAVSEQISQSLRQKVLSTDSRGPSGTRGHFRWEGVLESPASSFSEGDPETKEGMPLSCNHDRARA